MTPAILGLIIFGIFVIIFVWDKLPMATSAILCCAIMVLLGLADFKTAFGEFASTTVIMLVAVMVIGSAIAETGLAAKVGGIIMKYSGGNERVLLIISFVLAMFLSTFVTNITVLAIFIPIIFALAKTNSKINPLNLVIPLTLAVNMGGITTLVGSSQQMTAQGLLEEYGFEGFKVFDFLPFGLILGAVTLLYCIFIGYPLGKKIWGNRTNVEAEIQASEKTDYKASKMIIMSVIFVLMVIFYITQKVPFTDIEVSPVTTAVTAAVLCIVTGCISQKKAILDINWNIVGRLGACLGIAKVLNKCGSIDLVAEWFMDLAGANISPLLLFIIMVVFAQLVSYFISNSTAISVTLLVIIAIAETLPINVPAFAMGITLSSSMGAACPLSGSTWGISMSAGYKFRDYFKYGIAIDIITLIIILITVPAFMGLTV